MHTHTCTHTHAHVRTHTHTHTYAHTHTFLRSFKFRHGEAAVGHVDMSRNSITLQHTATQYVYMYTNLRAVAIAEAATLFLDMST